MHVVHVRNVHHRLGECRWRAHPPVCPQVMAPRKSEESTMYVVAGVSGNTGKVVAETLLSQKKPVRVIVRDAAKGAAWKARGAEVAVAELDDVPALTKALAGAEGAYLLLP